MILATLLAMLMVTVLVAPILDTILVIMRRGKQVQAIVKEYKGSTKQFYPVLFKGYVYEFEFPFLKTTVVTKGRHNRKLDVGEKVVIMVDSKRPNRVLICGKQLIINIVVSCIYLIFMLISWIYLANIIIKLWR